MKKLVAIAVITIASFSSNAFGGWFDKEFEKPLVFDITGKNFPSNKVSLEANTVYFPESFNESKKYPAVVLLPSCSGFKRWNKEQYHNWLSTFAKEGYVTIALDHMTPRGKGNRRPFNCNPRSRAVDEENLVKDMYDATESLSVLGFVNPNEIFAIGYSLGGMTIGWGNSEYRYKKLAKGKQRLVTGASLYAGCVYGRDGQHEYLYSDTDTPLLWLMGEADHEAPISGCTSRIRYIQRNVPEFEFHTYKGATHCWDCIGLDGFSKRVPNGSKVTYHYNDDVTKDSIKRVLEHFNKYRNKPFTITVTGGDVETK